MSKDIIYVGSLLNYLEDWLNTLRMHEENGERVKGIATVVAYGDDHIFRADVGAEDITLNDVARMLYALKFTEKRLVDMWDEFTSDIEFKEDG